ncbi:hypothetical protein [Rhodanobacter hydrolyticus]|uniref:Uncharacterized protein n=1 Tax=Rhodanobacter hydrolyticus TaxID=2250595 RepID=A0ABW8J4B1_9GAMM
MRFELISILSNTIEKADPCLLTFAVDKAQKPTTLADFIGGRATMTDKHHGLTMEFDIQADAEPEVVVLYDGKSKLKFRHHGTLSPGEELKQRNSITEVGYSYLIREFR